MPLKALFLVCIKEDPRWQIFCCFVKFFVPKGDPHHMTTALSDKALKVAYKNYRIGWVVCACFSNRTLVAFTRTCAGTCTKMCYVNTPM